MMWHDRSRRIWTCEGCGFTISELMLTGIDAIAEAFENDRATKAATEKRPPWRPADGDS